MNLSGNWMLRGCGLLALVLAASLNACSSSDDDEGTAGTGGASGSGGTSGSGGAAGDGSGGSSGDGSGGTAGTGGAAGDTGTGGSSGEAGMGGGAGQAGGGGGDEAPTAKFCNNVAFGEMDITLRLDIGTAPNVVSISALTGTCTPVPPMPCTEIPAGTDIPVAMIDVDASETPIATATLTTVAGESWLLVGDVDDLGPLVDGERIPEGLMCSDITYDDVFQPEQSSLSSARSSAAATSRDGWRSLRSVARTANRLDLFGKR